MNGNYIKLFRKLQQWEWYQNSNMVHLFIHLLLSANWKEGRWQGKDVKRGQFITGRKSLKEQTGISEQVLRTCLARLEDSKEITIKSTNKYSIITICNYNDYQDVEIASNQQVTSNQPTNNQQITTIEEGKEVKKKTIVPPNEAQEIAFILSESIQQRDPNYYHLLPERREKNILTWSSDIDKINRIDGRSWDEIKQVVQWVVQDDFWKTNILSGSKLRKQFSTLILKCGEVEKKDCNRCQYRVNNYCSENKPNCKQFLEI